MQRQRAHERAARAAGRLGADGALAGVGGASDARARCVRARRRPAWHQRPAEAGTRQVALTLVAVTVGVDGGAARQCTQ